MAAIDVQGRGYLNAERYSAIGDEPVHVLDLRSGAVVSRSAAIVIGVDFDGKLPSLEAAHFDLLLTSASGAPAPWISVRAASLSDEVEELRSVVLKQPVPAAMLCQTLRLCRAVTKPATGTPAKC